MVNGIGTSNLGSWNGHWSCSLTFPPENPCFMPPRFHAVMNCKSRPRPWKVWPPAKSSKWENVPGPFTNPVHSGQSLLVCGFKHLDYFPFHIWYIWHNLTSHWLSLHDFSRWWGVTIKQFSESSPGLDPFSLVTLYGNTCRNFPFKKKQEVRFCVLVLLVASLQPSKMQS